MRGFDVLERTEGEKEAECVGVPGGGRLRDSRGACERDAMDVDAGGDKSLVGCQQHSQTQIR